MDQVRRCAVDADDSAAAFARNDIGLDSGAVGDVDDRHLLALEQVGGLHQRGIERDRAHIVQISLSHRCAVNLGLHHDPHHSGRLLVARRVQDCRSSDSLQVLRCNIALAA